MPIKLRIATFNLENLDDKPEQSPSLDERIALMRPQLQRVDADILCLQEVNGQEEPGHPRRLLALERLIEGTPYAGYHRATTLKEDGTEVYDERNLVILSRYEIDEHHQYKHDFTGAPRYQKVTSVPPEDSAREITWERPILYAKVLPGNGTTLHLVNLHLKSRIPSYVEGQREGSYKWKSPGGWAEGFFISSMRRVGQALEARVLIDEIFDDDEDALIVVCGDFNSDSDEVPVEAIRGNVEKTGNNELAGRVMVPCESTIPASSRYSHLYLGKGRMIDHLLASRALFSHYKGAEIHNELLHDESIAFATDKKYPESDHAPVVGLFELPD